MQIHAHLCSPDTVKAPTITKCFYVCVFRCMCGFVAPPCSAWSCVLNAVCAVKFCAEKDISIPTPLPVHPSSHPSIPCSPSSLIPSLRLHISLPSDIPLPPSLVPLHPSPTLLSPSLLLSLPLSFHGHLKWLQINQRHSTEFASEPLLWENEAIYLRVCGSHN